MSQFHSLTVSAVQHETRDCIAVTFAVPPDLAAAFAYRQGQHLTLRATIGGEQVRRVYSICSAVQDQALRVAIKRTAGGVFSCWANDTLAPGMVIDVMAPLGHFNLPLDSAVPHHYLGIAAGSGITPILSIMKTTLMAEPHSRFTLVYGNRSASSTIFKDALLELKDLYLERLSIVYVMSREQQDIDLFNGRISADKCRQLLAHWVPVADLDGAFICGPEDMMQGACEALLEAGMPKAVIKFELFAASVPVHRRAADAAAPGQTEVTVIMDGAHSSFTMARERESVLDAGLGHGLDMRYSCKSGVCATCRCKVTQGRVEMDVHYALEDYEIARGFVLSCQSFPVSDSVTLDFDQAD